MLVATSKSAMTADTREHEKDEEARDAESDEISGADQPKQGHCNFATDGKTKQNQPTSSLHPHSYCEQALGSLKRSTAATLP